MDGNGPIVCPDCHVLLRDGGSGLECPACGHRIAYDDARRPEAPDNLSGIYGG